MNGWIAATVASLATVAALATASPAAAFDTGPHQEMTRSALLEEGFGGDASSVVQINNWFTDLYHDISAEKMPYSGHAGFFKRLLLTATRVENWPASLVAASTRSHFDNWPGVDAEAARPSLATTIGVTAEWDRLRRSVWSLVQEAREKNDPEMLLGVLGISLHSVQDFYTHTNWIEPFTDSPGIEGPGWEERGFGTYPTWFDVPVAVRDAATIYGDNTDGHPRPHGLWNADGNKSLKTAMNKDWPGRPHYLKSAISAYFATRQWIEAVRSWVGDDAFWSRAQELRADKSLDHDLEGRFKIMLYSGHWQGQGEPLGGDAHGPGGSLLDLRQAVKKYFQKTVRYDKPGDGFGVLYGKTPYRARFEKLLIRVAERQPQGQLGAVPSSQALQRSTRLIVLKVLSMRGEGLGDPGPDDADMFANVEINGQAMTSAVIHGHDKYNFPDPQEPFTWFKAVPAGGEQGEPIESIEVEVRTANKRWAGTDDSVFLRLGGSFRFQLDKSLTNDFERGDRDVYSVPIDEAVKRGMRVGDISWLALEKSPDRLAGGWKLGGVRLIVNGRVLYENNAVDRWLEDDHRVWTAPDFEPSDPLSTKVPIVISLREDDSLYGNDDEGDINPYGHRRNVSLGYAPGDPLQATTKGGGKLGGHVGDGNGASIVYRLETLTPELMRLPAAPAPPGPPPAPGPKPDLKITAFNIFGLTVKNQGGGDAGPFRARVANSHTLETRTFPGLPAGASVTWVPRGLSCFENYLGTVDDLSQVAEADETNNTAEAEAVIC